ncbi:DUF6099 family protein [uncultured Streptomyces sp.]|uniref:DUF6099 family protein n=1 Tax=uncultured Streptomyces sp. TaxID=174707 RepID=UPI00260CB3FB|nr:DUF6099 family protein [uncultured Streptomyces sp.]
MEAERLVDMCRRALAGSRSAPDVMAEVWQAQTLAAAVGARLAAAGPAELRAEARGLSETGGAAGAGPDHPTVPAGGARAARLTEVADVRSTLTGLGLLLGDVGIALVAVACETGDDSLYWQCIEAIDAADESVDHLHTMLRRLTDQERDRARERDGPYGALRG